MAKEIFLGVDGTIFSGSAQAAYMGLKVAFLKIDGEYSLALAISKEMYTLYKAEGHEEGQALAMSDMGLLYSALGNTSEAIIMTLKAQSIIQRLGNEQFYYSNLSNWIQIKRCLGEDTEALTQEIMMWALQNDDKMLKWQMDLLSKIKCGPNS